MKNTNQDTAQRDELAQAVADHKQAADELKRVCNQAVTAAKKARG